MNPSVDNGRCSTSCKHVADLSTLTASPCVTRFHSLSRGLTVSSSFLTVWQILIGFFPKLTVLQKNKHRRHIPVLLKKVFLVWLTKIKQAVLSWALLSIKLVKTHIDSPFQWKPLSDLLKIANVFTTESLVDNILASKYWGTKAVFHKVGFWQGRFFCGSFKTKAASCDNIQTTCRKKFVPELWYQLFLNQIPPHSCLLRNFSIIVGVVPGFYL